MLPAPNHSVAMDDQDIVDLAAGDDDNENEDALGPQWQCPRCTLLNPPAASRCEACRYYNQTTRSPDSSRRERLIGGEDEYFNDIVPLEAELDALWGNPTGSNTRRTSDSAHSWARGNGLPVAASAGSTSAWERARASADLSPSWAQSENRGSAGGRSQVSSTGTYMGGGVALGTVLGMAGAAARGTSMRQGAFHGALSGAVGGALLSDFMSDDHSNTPHQQGNEDTDDRDAAMSAFLQNNAQNRLRAAGQPLQTQRRRLRPPTHATSQPTLFPNTGSDEERDIVLDTLFRSLVQGGGSRNLVWHRMGDGGAEGASYEHLLELFGDGTENRGADASVVSALPSSTIQDVEKLPEDARKCSICLEDFEAGDTRRMLPCLHGFHEACVDRWLSSNGTCPVCKHSVTD